MTATPALSIRPESAPDFRSRARMLDLIAAEWIKLRSLRSTFWSLGACVLYAGYVAYNGSRQEIGTWPHLTAAERAGEDLGHTVFFGPSWLILMIVTGAIGALVIVGEHASGLIRTTFTAVPDRRRVITAKAAVVAAVLAMTGFAAAAGCYGIGLVEMSGHAQAPGIAFSAAIRGCVGTALLFVACGLAGMAIGVLIRNTAATIVAIVVVFGLLPLAVKSQGYWWTGQAVNAMPVFAWFRLVAGAGAGHVADASSGSVTQAWVTLAAWSLVAVLVSVAGLIRRDV